MKTNLLGVDQTSNLIVIAEAVINGVTVKSAFGAKSYSVSELMALQKEQLDTFYVELSTQAGKYGLSLLSSDKVPDILVNRMKLLKALIEVKREIENTEKIQSKERQDAIEKLQLLYKSQKIGEEKAILAMSDEERDAEIKRLEKLTKA